MKKFRQNVALALAYIAAAPFLLVGFIVWLFRGNDNPCVGCPYPSEACEECKENPENRKKKKNRKCP